MKHYLACSLTLAVAACSGSSDGPAAPDPGPPMVHPISTGGTTDRVVITLPRLRRIHVDYSN